MREGVLEISRSADSRPRLTSHPAGRVRQRSSRRWVSGSKLGSFGDTLGQIVHKSPVTISMTLAMAESICRTVRGSDNGQYLSFTVWLV